MKKTLSTLIALSALTAMAGAEAKNIFLMISDGLGFNGWKAARYYEGGLPYDNRGFDFYGCTNYAAGGSYDPAANWSEFNVHLGGATDSAAAATALYTGHKTYSGAIGIDVNGNPVKTIAEIAAGLGKATAAVSSVQYNHATPGAVDAHNVSRGNYAEIAADMIRSDLDVIMGCDSKAPKDAIYQMAADNGFTVINDSNLNDWATLADGSYNSGQIPTKVFGAFHEPAGYTNGRTTPTLAQMTQGALNVLAQNPNGSFMMVEGGAVDWNNHGNNFELMMREQVDFDNACQVVMNWIEANGGWEENLMIITSDHETGSIWGPVKGEFNPIVDNGVGELPDISYNSGSHTNQLVPLWAKGAGAEVFQSLVDGNDALADAFWTEARGWSWNGDYVDNTDVYQAMVQAVPEPTTIALLGLGAGALLRRRRR